MSVVDRKLHYQARSDRKQESFIVHCYTFRGLLALYFRYGTVLAKSARVMRASS